MFVSTLYKIVFSAFNNRLYKYKEDPMNGKNGALVSSREFYVLGRNLDGDVVVINHMGQLQIQFYQAEPEKKDYRADLSDIFKASSVFRSWKLDDCMLAVYVNEHASDEEITLQVTAALRRLFDMDEDF